MLCPAPSSFCRAPLDAQFSCCFHAHSPSQPFSIVCILNIASGNTFIPHSFTHFPLQAEILPLLEQMLCKAVPHMGTNFNCAYSFGFKKKPQTCRVSFSKRDSFKVAKQLKFINAERQVTKREEKTGEAVSSGLTNSLSLRRKSHSLWDVFISWPYGKFSLLGLLAGACCIRISSKGRSSSSGIKHLPILPGAPGQSCHTTASVRRKLEVV